MTEKNSYLEVDLSQYQPPLLKVLFTVALLSLSATFIYEYLI